MQKQYIPQPLDTSHIILSEKLMEISELLAKNIHDVWAKQRIAEGWRYGMDRNDLRKEHPGLVPYEELPENEKEYDRNTALETIKFLISQGFEIIYK